MMQPRLFVVHVMAGTLAGTDAWFHDPQAQVSAHLGHGKAGERYQWVDTEAVAWAEAAYNLVAWSAEHEGESGDELTAAQVASLAFAIVQWHRATGFPIQRTSDPEGIGVIGHSELGLAGGDHPDCPGAPVLAQLPAVIAMAQDLSEGGDTMVSYVDPQGHVHLFYEDPSGNLVEWVNDGAGGRIWNRYVHQPAAA